MRRTVVVSILLVAVSACGLPLSGAPPEPVADDLVTRVRDAIEHGKKYLRSAAAGRGEWERASSGLLATAQPGGTTALALLALLNCGVKPDDRDIQAGLQFLRGIEPQYTYVVGLQTMVLAEVGDPLDLPRIQRNVDWLVKGQIVRGGVLQGWGYNPNTNGADNSNSQYALLGLYAGRQAGAKVDDAVWETIFDFYKRTQLPDGAWYYSIDYGERNARLTMSVAGLCGLEIAGQQINMKRRKLAPDGSDPQCGIYPENEPIRKALAWLEDMSRFQLRDPLGRTFYNVYGVERAGRLTGRRTIAGRDWYREGCKFLIGLQHEDGSWYTSNSSQGESTPPIATSFALLFLSKGRTPILISKFAYGPAEGWNNKHHDARHLVEFASKELFKRQPLAWQVYDARRLAIGKREELRDEIAVLVQSPILFMNGHEAPRFTEVQRQILRGYLDGGGFLLAEACCGRKEFTDGFRALMKQLFPENDLAPLRPDHPIWTAHFAIRPGSVPLEGIEQGCKTVVVFSPVPLAGYWEINQWTPRAVNADVPSADRGTLAFRLAGNIITYATGLEMPKPRLTREDLPDDREDRHVPRGFLKVAQLRHEGDWEPAPRAMTNLMQYVRSEHKLDVTLEKDDLAVDSPDILLYKFLYMHGRRSFDIPADKLDNLRADLKTGGLLLADACCGKPDFDRAFRTFAARLFPDAKLEPIPPDDPLFGPDVNGMPVAIIRLRKERPDGQGAEPEFRDTRPTQLEGIKLNGRWVVIYSRYDIGCALERHASSDCKGYDHDSALRIGAAAVLYMLKK
jgi:hypothetical protein